MDATWEGIGTLSQDCTTLDCPFPVFPSLPWLAECLQLPDGTQRTQRKSRRLNGVYSSKQQGDTERLVIWPSKSSAWFQFRVLGGDGSWPPSDKWGCWWVPLFPQFGGIDTGLEILLSFNLECESCIIWALSISIGEIEFSLRYKGSLYLRWEKEKLNKKAQTTF